MPNRNIHIFDFITIDIDADFKLFFPINSPLLAGIDIANNLFTHSELGRLLTVTLETSLREKSKIEKEEEEEALAGWPSEVETGAGDRGSQRCPSYLIIRFKDRNYRAHYEQALHLSFETRKWKHYDEDRNTVQKLPVGALPRPKLPGMEAEIERERFLPFHLRGLIPEEAMQKYIWYLLEEYLLDRESVDRRLGEEAGFIYVWPRTPTGLGALKVGALKLTNPIAHFNREECSYLYRYCKLLGHDIRNIAFIF